MTSIPIQFAAELARASQGAYRVLRGFERDRAEDVLAAATAWCWENRAKFDATVEPLGRWFSRRLRAELQALRRSEHRYVELDESTLVSREAPDVAVEIEQSALVLAKRDAQILRMVARGERVQDIARELHCRVQDVWRVRHRLEAAPRTDTLAASAAVTRESPNDPPLARIDYEIASILSTPRDSTGECRPCWRCLWYDGYQGPDTYFPPKCVDPEVRAAIEATERRKIEIAKEVST